MRPLSERLNTLLDHVEQAGNQQPAARPGISCGLSETREHVQEQAQLIADECMASLNGGGYSSPLKSPSRSRRTSTIAEPPTLQAQFDRNAQLAHAMVYHAPPGPQAAEAERLRLSLAEQAAAASAPGFFASKQMSESVKRMKDGVEVTCQFDEHFRESDGVPDPGQSLHLPHVRRVGPLEELYTSYARFMEVRQDGRGGTYVMSRQELWEMCEDMEIIPAVRRGDVSMAFKASYQPPAVPPAQKAPDELDFFGFTECMARVALLVFSGMDVSTSGSPVDAWKRKVVALQQKLGLDNQNTTRLRQHLAQLSRIAKQRRQRAVERKWEYVAGVEAPATTLAEVASDVPLTVLHALLRYEEDERASADEPLFRQFSTTGIHAGTVVLPPGFAAQRRYRVVIRNRGERVGLFSVALHNLPMVEASYSERPLASGISRVVELYATFTQPGQWLGYISLTWEGEGSEKAIRIPMLACCELYEEGSGLTVGQGLIHHSKLRHY